MEHLSANYMFVWPVGPNQIGLTVNVLRRLIVVLSSNQKIKNYYLQWLPLQRDRVSIYPIETVQYK